jgi:hypothetical protein
MISSSLVFSPNEPLTKDSGLESSVVSVAPATPKEVTVEAAIPNSRRTRLIRTETIPNSFEMSVAGTKKKNLLVKGWFLLALLVRQSGSCVGFY